MSDDRLTLTTPILITGCARSGTSMTAGVISLHGAFGGEVDGSTRYNQKGMFENRSLKKKVKWILEEHGYDPLGQHPLPPLDGGFLDNGQLGDAVLRTIKKQGYVEGPWYYKCAKLCLMWELWAEHFPEGRYIIVRRKKDDIIRSCFRTPFMRKCKDYDEWSAWVDHHLACFEQMKHNLRFVYEVYPPHGFEDMVNWLGLEYNQAAVEEFVDPSLYHQRAA